MRSTPRSVMSSRTRRRVMIGVLTSAALVFAACGGDDDDASSDTGAPSSDAPADTARTCQPIPRATRQPTPGASRHRRAGCHRWRSTGEPIKVMTVAPINTQLPPYPNIHEAARGLRAVDQRQGRDQRATAGGDRCATTAATPTRTPTAPEGGRGEGRRTGRLVHLRRQPHHADPRGEQDRVVRLVLPDRRDRDLQPDLVRHRLELRNSRRRRGEDGRRRLQEAPPSCTSRPRRCVRDRRRQAAFEVQGLRRPTMPRSSRSRSRPRTTAPRSREAIDGTDCICGGIADSNWAAFLPAMESSAARSACTGTRATSTRKIAEQFPELTQDGISVNVVPEHRGTDVGRLPGRARGVRGSGPRLEQPRRPRHVVGLQAFIDIVERHGRARSPTRRSSPPPTATSKLETGGMVRRCST